MFAASAALWWYVTRKPHVASMPFTLNGNLSLPAAKAGSIDYFITDQRHDTRIIQTEETQWSRATASMKTANGRGGIEEGLFGQTGTNNEVAATRTLTNDIPGQQTGQGWQSNQSQYVSRLDINKKVGPNQLLKVMAGDQLSAIVNYYYKQNVSGSSGSNIAGSVLNMLVSTIAGSPAVSVTGHGAASSITGNLNTNTAFTNFRSNDAGNSSLVTPKAYLNIIFFDERLNFVAESSTSKRVITFGGNATPIDLLGIPAPKNGYAYIYISNESAEPVFFDTAPYRKGLQ